VKLKLTILISILSLTIAYAHRGDEHKKDTTESMGISSDTVVLRSDTMKHKQHHEDVKKTVVNRTATLEEFPTLHPLIVHFPIVLLLLAALSQLTGLFLFQNQLSWITLFLLFGGVLSAYIASYFIHPHTVELPKTATWVLEQHEFYASCTRWTALGGLVTKIISHFYFKRKLWIEVVVLGALIGAAFFVSKTGHYGAQLVHIEGIGVQGEYLETDEHNHSH